MTQDAYNRRVDKELDSRAAGVSPEYSQGGAEYYNQILQRNIALRHFQGDQGRKMYNAHGEIVQGVIRVKTANIIDRRDICANQNFIKAS